MLAHADRLPQVNTVNTMPSPGQSPLLYCHSEENKQSEWSGWAWISDKCRTAIPVDADEDTLKSYLLSPSGCNGLIFQIQKLLNVRSFADLLSSQKAALNKEFTGLMFTGREVEDGIWLSRNVSLHPTIRLVPPVYIGENCRIARGVKFESNVVVSRDCVIDEKSTFANALVFPGSYTGKALELHDTLIDRNRIINVRIGEEILITDDFILASLSESYFGKLIAGVFSQLAGILCLLICMPFLFATALLLKIFRNGSVFYKKEAVFLPAHSDSKLRRTYSLFSFSPFYPEKTDRELCSSGISDFFLRFMPSLINIARGEIHFVGVAPRSEEEISALQKDWRSLYLRSKAGIVTEADVNFGPNLTVDELYSAEAMYTVSKSLRYDLKLLVKYFFKIPGIFPGRY